MARVELAKGTKIDFVGGNIKFQKNVEVGQNLTVHGTEIVSLVEQLPAGLETDIINEYTTDAGVTIDSVLLKDNVVQASQLKSTVATGTAPLVVSSTTKVANLNVEAVDGIDLPNTCATVLTDHNKSTHDALNIDADTVDGIDLPNTCATVLTDHNKATHDALGIDADTVDGYHLSTILQVRQDVLDLFTNPKVLISTSSMNLLLASADITEYQAGNITSTTQELKIIGGSASSTGNSGVGWRLPETCTKIYIKAKMASNGDAFFLDCYEDDPFDNPNTNLYCCYIDVPAPNQFRLAKQIGGVHTVLAYETSTEIVHGTYFDIEFFLNLPSLSAWRNGNKLEATDVDISSITSVGIRMYDNSTTSEEYGRVKGHVVIIYE